MIVESVAKVITLLAAYAYPDFVIARLEYDSHLNQCASFSSGCPQGARNLLMGVLQPSAGATGKISFQTRGVSAPGVTISIPAWDSRLF